MCKEKLKLSPTFSFSSLEITGSTTKSTLLSSKAPLLGRLGVWSDNFSTKHLFHAIFNFDKKRNFKITVPSTVGCVFFCEAGLRGTTVGFDIGKTSVSSTTKGFGIGKTSVFSIWLIFTFNSGTCS